MSISKQFREELTRDFSFITGEAKEINPIKKGNPRSRSASPRPVSAKSQLQQLKIALDLESRQKKVEEFKKKISQRKKILTTQPEKTSGNSTPDFNNKKNPNAEQKETARPKGLRTRFPKQLLEDFPFLDSSDEEVLPLFKLFDSKFGKNEVTGVLHQIVSNN
jgi:hypothetical protein